MSNILENKLYSVLKLIGFVKSEKDYGKDRHELFYKNYTFNKIFYHDSSTLHYYLQCNIVYYINGYNDVEDVLIIINEIFKKEIRVNKIEKIFT